MSELSYALPVLCARCIVVLHPPDYEAAYKTKSRCSSCGRRT